MKKLTIIEAERQGPRVKSKKVVKEAINTDEIKMVIGSWGAYNSANEKALGSKWLTLSDYTDWEDIEDELREQGFDLEGEDEELFIQDVDGLPTMGEYESPQAVFETLYESDVLNDTSAREAFDVFCEVRGWDDFKHIVDSYGANWVDYIYIYPGYDWYDLGRELFEQTFPELLEHDVIDNYFDFEAYGESFQYDTFERYSGGIVSIEY